MKIKEYLSANRKQIIADLASLISIPSVSAQPEHKPDMIRCAERWKYLLLEAGADKAEIMETDGNPVVFASKIISPDYPTALIYAHYDVMPVEPIELWNTPPFELTDILKDEARMTTKDNRSSKSKVLSTHCVTEICVVM